MRQILGGERFSAALIAFFRSMRLNIALNVGRLGHSLADRLCIDHVRLVPITFR